MITAAQAKELAGPTVEERVEAVGLAIRELAKNGERKIHLHDDFWVRGGYSGTTEYKKACDLLRSYGYTVEFFYEERQFVDMYTIVSW